MRATTRLLAVATGLTIAAAIALLGYAFHTQGWGFV